MQTREDLWCLSELHPDGTDVETEAPGRKASRQSHHFQRMADTVSRGLGFPNWSPLKGLLFPAKGNLGGRGREYEGVPTPAGDKDWGEEGLESREKRGESSKE